MSLFTWSEDRFLLYATLVFAVLWIASVGPIRTWASDVGLRHLWWFGIAPSLFSGMAFATWQALATQVRAETAAIYSICLTTLAEAIQLALPNATADLWDLWAGFVGAIIGALVVHWRERIGEHPSRPNRG